MKRSPVWPLLLLVAGFGAYAQPVRYTISAQLDDAAGLLRGEETVRYRNLTTDTLGSLWVHLYPNAFKARSTPFGRELEAAGRYDFSLAPERDRGWMTIDSVESGGRATLTAETETELGLFLAPPLAPGESLRLRIEFTVKVPVPFSELSRRGRGFVLAHWYPQVAAHTEAGGWHTGGYHVLGHSPGEFGDYDVVLTLSSDLAVAATGEADDSDWARWPPKMRPGRRDSTKTLRFTARNVSDFAIVANPDLVMFQDSVAGTRIRVFARYPARFDWLSAVELAKDIVERYSEWYGPCPSAQLTIVQTDGVASADASHPGLIVIAQRPIPATHIFEQMLARQIARQWFSHPAGIDELKDPWLAYGPAVYSETRYLREKYGETNLLDNPLLGWLLKGAGAEYYHRVSYYAAASNRILSSDPLTCRDGLGYTAENQSKPGLLFLEAERELGQPKFDSLMREYLRASAGTHTGPEQLARFFPDVVARMDPEDTFAFNNWGRLGSGSVEVRPVVALPKTDKYQIFFGPYAWIDNYHGLQLSAWAQGRQFYDAGPLRGRHQWSVSEVYSTKIDDWHSSVNYQTPLSFINDRLRVYAALDYSLIDAGAKLFFSQELGPAFRQPRTTIDFGYRFLDLYNLRFRKSLAWDSARTADIRLRLAHTYESRLFLGGAQVYLRRGLTALGSNYDYLRAGLEQSHTWRGLRPLNLTLRMFAGYVWGNVPAQDQFYLSGGLTSNGSEPVSWGYEGWTSGQEHWHYDADVNCRGYAGGYAPDDGYVHGRAAYGLNFYLEPAKFIQPFFDLGNVGDSLGQPDFFSPRMDAGIRLKLGPLYADFPIWRYQVGTGKHEFAFRWMLGLKMGGILGGS
jgi:hypothetical protein